MDTLDNNRVITLFYQELIEISTYQTTIKKRLKGKFNDDFYHFSVPFKSATKIDYFERLAQSCDLDIGINMPDQWKYAMQNKLIHSQRFMLFVTDLEDGNEECNREFAQ